VEGTTRVSISPSIIIAISQTTDDDIAKVYPEMTSKVRIVYHGTDHLASWPDGTIDSHATTARRFALFVGDRS
jgi:hypothetical protein